VAEAVSVAYDLCLISFKDLNVKVLNIKATNTKTRIL